MNNYLKKNENQIVYGPTLKITKWHHPEMGYFCLETEVIS